MESRWLQAVAKNILHLSNSQDVATALKEWFYTGTCYDLGEPCETCQLCDHQDIRYQFEIQNQHTNHTLLIGSECITRFNLEGVVSGRHLDATQTTERVQADRRKLIDDARKNRVIKCLIQLGQKEQEAGRSDFNCSNFIDYLQDRGAFTPKQLALLLWRMDHYHIEFRPTDFKLVMRRGREQSQLLEMQTFQLMHILPAMTTGQREWILKRRRI